MIGRILAGVAAFCLLAATAFPAQAEPRIALVIGNSNYGSDIGKLTNPANDAALMASALQQTGFTVITVVDADQKKMKRAIADFGEKLSNAGANATGLFYYAGHGIQSKGVNYLIPVGAQIAKEADVNIESVTADHVMEQMEFAANAVNIIILDACRNNPIARSMRSANRGLAPMHSDSVRGTFIAYSTSPGQTAADGTGRNSPYTTALAKTIVQPGVGIEEVFRGVRAEVMAKTQNQQIPWDSFSLTAPFFFKGAQFNTASQAAPVPAPSAAPSDAEEKLWKYVETTKQADDYQAYLDQYPQGAYAPIARSRLAQLGAGAPREQAPVPEVQPAAAPTPAPEPGSIPEIKEASTTDAPEAEVVTAEPATVLRDSRGVDCKVKDLSRSNADLAICKKVLGSGGGGGGGVGGGGSRSTGSQGWK
jgi:carboxyl-terminal processing protease